MGTDWGMREQGKGACLHVWCTYSPLCACAHVWSGEAEKEGDV